MDVQLVKPSRARGNQLNIFPHSYHQLFGVDQDKEKDPWTIFLSFSLPLSDVAFSTCLLISVGIIHWSRWKENQVYSDCWYAWVQKVDCWALAEIRTLLLAFPVFSWEKLPCTLSSKTVRLPWNQSDRPWSLAPHSTDADILMNPMWFPCTHHVCSSSSISKFRSWKTVFPVQSSFCPVIFFKCSFKFLLP